LQFCPEILIKIQKVIKYLKKGKGLAFLNHVLFMLSNVLLQRYDSANFEKDKFLQIWQLSLFQANDLLHIKHP
jgi:hypothetical protein